MQPHLRQQRPWLLRSALLLQEAALAARPRTLHTHTSFCLQSWQLLNRHEWAGARKAEGGGGKLAAALLAVRPRRIILRDDRNLISLCEIAPGLPAMMKGGGVPEYLQKPVGPAPLILRVGK